MPNATTIRPTPLTSGPTNKQQSYIRLFAAILSTCGLAAFALSSIPTQAASGAAPLATLTGHVTWQGRPNQPDPLQQLPLTIILQMGSTRMTYTPATDSNGTFNIALSGLPNGTYTWWAKGTQSLANSGTVALTGGNITLEVGTLRSGDANNDNIVDIGDFILVRTVFGLACGNPGYDTRADLTGDCLVDMGDFTLVRNNYGQAGAAAPPVPPTNTATSTPTRTATSVPSNTPTTTPPPHRYGLVGQGGLGDQIDPALLQAQYNAGVRVRFVQLGWDVLQPTGPTSWDAGIANAFQQRIDALIANGPDVQLVLDLGIQYSPGWVGQIDPLMDQYGHVWQAGFPYGGANVYWSPTVRQDVATYIGRVFAGLNFRGRLWAVRVGAYNAELMYPEQANAGQNLSFWAFDTQAQAQSPVPGWHPGDPSPNQEAQRFYYWYVDNLTGTFNFFLTEIRRYYSGYVAPVTPGTGLWSGNVSQLISHNLYDPTLNWYGTGNYWQRIFAALPGAGAGVINWCSSVGDGSGNDDSPNWWEWSSARVQATLAHQNGRAIYGENPSRNAYDTTGGADVRTTMQWIIATVQANDYLGLLWLSQSDMANSQYASLDQYRALIAQYP